MGNQMRKYSPYKMMYTKHKWLNWLLCSNLNNLKRSVLMHIKIMKANLHFKTLKMLIIYKLISQNQ
jgi:hypothetical protein